jgi:acyl carrier protein
MTNIGGTVQTRLRQILHQQGALSVDVARLTSETDLYAAGLTSLASVDLMLAIEQSFGVSFPDETLNRGTFSSIGSIAATIERLEPEARDDLNC